MVIWKNSQVRCVYPACGSLDLKYMGETILGPRFKCRRCKKEFKILTHSGYCDVCQWLQDKKWTLLFMDWFIDSHNDVFLKYYKEFKPLYEELMSGKGLLQVFED